MNTILAFLLKQIADILLGQGILQRIIDRVIHWQDEEISSAEKRDNVLADFEIIGLKLSKSLANFGLELAIQYLKAKG